MSDYIGFKWLAEVGNGACVALVRHYADVPNHAIWKAGKPVLGDALPAKGTAIATFVNGVYPNHATGNHAAFYLKQGLKGFWVMDQWVGAKKPTISSRFIRSNPGKRKDGSYSPASDNANAYFVIER